MKQLLEIVEMLRIFYKYLENFIFPGLISTCYFLQNFILNFVVNRELLGKNHEIVTRNTKNAYFQSISLFTKLTLKTIVNYVLVPIKFHKYLENFIVAQKISQLPRKFHNFLENFIIAQKIS